jgi:hypothetical protein
LEIPHNLRGFEELCQITRQHKAWREDILKVLNKEDLSDEVAIVVGTRPGIIKFSPVVRALTEKDVPFFIIHTGQHYSYNMDS